MEKNEILKQVQNIVADHNGILPNEVPQDANFEKDLKMDSLDFTEVIMQSEVDFKCSLPEEDLDKIKTINDLVDLIYSQKTSL